MYQTDVKLPADRAASFLDQVRVVLVWPSHTGNIGAVARALKNMGISQLAIIKPRCEIDEEAYARAGHAKDILERVSLYTSLDEAIADCSVVYATRGREARVKWPELDAREAAADIRQKLAGQSEMKVAILFGPERTGLLNEQFEKSHYHVVIPSHPGYTSLNLAQAVQIVAYELYQLEAADKPVIQEPVAYAKQQAMEYLYKDLETRLTAKGYIQASSAQKSMGRIRRIFQKAQLTPEEVQLLTGAIAALDKSEAEA